MNNRSIVVEAAVEGVDEAVAAERAGADRLELCANLSVGGTTPSGALIDAVLQSVRVPVVVMIRPRGGNFVYSEGEVAQMVNDIEMARTMEIAGIATGALTTDGFIDVDAMRRLVNAADALPVVFHRAFDSITDGSDSINRLIELGVARVLTSGGAASAIEGADSLAALVRSAGSDITVLAGGKVRTPNVRELLVRSGVTEIHSRFVDAAQMRSLVAATKQV